MEEDREDALSAQGQEDAETPPVFDAAFRDRLAELMVWRRDVRRFRVDPVPEALVDRLLDLAQLSASVGNAQPWRWVRVDSPAVREAVRANFRACNEAALGDYDDERGRLYASLKLEGLERAPLQFAVFCDEATEQGHGLGRKTMPDMLRASVAGMIANFWLLSRAEGVGVGWVSILDAPAIAHLLDVPAEWSLVAYLCVGFPEEFHADPELVRHGWQDRTALGRAVRVV
jgi:5,6-dimethylbenzimidazole synthase